MAAAGDALKLTLGNGITLDLANFGNDTFMTETTLLDYFDQYLHFGLAPDGTVSELKFDWDGGAVFRRTAE